MSEGRWLATNVPLSAAGCRTNGTRDRVSRVVASAAAQTEVERLRPILPRPSPLPRTRHRRTFAKVAHTMKRHEQASGSGSFSTMMTRTILLCSRPRVLTVSPRKAGARLFNNGGIRHSSRCRQWYRCTFSFPDSRIVSSQLTTTLLTFQFVKCGYAGSSE